MINPSNLKVPSTSNLAPPKAASIKIDSKGSMVNLSNGVPVREGLYTAVFNKVIHRHRFLKEAIAYTTEEICGASFWHLLSSGERKIAGICMHELVKLHRIPFIVAETDHEYPKKYHLINAIHFDQKGVDIWQ